MRHSRRVSVSDTVTDTERFNVRKFLCSQAFESIYTASESATCPADLNYLFRLDSNIYRGLRKDLLQSTLQLLHHACGMQHSHIMMPQTAQFSGNVNCD
jgi:hypothetical protein